MPMPTPHRRRKRASSTTPEMPGPRRIAIYTRRSTDDEHQPFSIDAQLTALHSYIRSQPGWALVAEYTDDASGASTDRPDLQRALRAAKTGRYDVLLVYRVARFSRRLSDLLDLLHDIDEAGVAFCSATEPFDTSTPIGRMLIQLLGVFAEFERETIIDRTINGMTAKARKGKWASGTRPYGYLVDRDTYKLLPNPDEAPILRDIFAMYTKQRLGTRAIAAELNRRGIPNRTGAPWSGYTVARILDNPAYTGDIVFRDVHDPLVDRDTFATARDLAGARADAHHRRAASPADYNLTGLITCPDCGCKYIGTAATGRSRQYRYYTCFSRNRYGSAGCTGVRLNADATDQAVLQALADFYGRADLLIERIVAAARREHHDANTGRLAELDAVTAMISKTEATIERYHAAFENGTMDDATAGPRLKDLRGRLAQLRARRDDLADTTAGEPPQPQPAVIEQVRAHLLHLVAAGTSAERKRAIEALVAEIRINQKGEVIPVFRIPTNSTGAVMDDDAGSRNGEDGVRCSSSRWART
ncbi:MAG: recombinase family protein [Dactylosporangium sp.]|nr:recombinase family protein [Dactylosporangium sp.]NNJ62054.1 recombinase family protein [Dactylosporangium sp.]